MFNKFAKWINYVLSVFGWIWIVYNVCKCLMLIIGIIKQIQFYKLVYGFIFFALCLGVGLLTHYIYKKQLLNKQITEQNTIFDNIFSNKSKSKSNTSVYDNTFYVDRRGIVHTNLQ
jgi:hypothetical protein